jgi:hypothetical protein
MPRLGSYALAWNVVFGITITYLLFVLLLLALFAS